MLDRLLILLLVAVFSGCASGDATPDVQISCGGLLPMDDDGLLSCFVLDGEWTLLQVLNGEQIRFTVQDVAITANGTIVIQRTPSSSAVYVLEGSTALSAAARTQIIRTGQQAILTQGSISESELIKINTIPALPLDSLARSITLPQLPTLAPELIALTRAARPDDTSTPDVNATQTPEATATQSCPAPADWVYTYTVQAGDSLARIATRYDITAQELQAANCIPNANVLRVGQILTVPEARFPTAVATVPIPTAIPTITPTPIVEFSFVADPATVAAGECSTLSWMIPDASPAKATTLNEVVVPPTGQLRICPDETITYTLQFQVNGLDEIQAESRTISVLSP